MNFFSTNHHNGIDTEMCSKDSTSLSARNTARICLILCMIAFIFFSMFQQAPAEQQQAKIIKPANDTLNNSIEPVPNDADASGSSGKSLAPFASLAANPVLQTNDSYSQNTYPVVLGDWWRAPAIEGRYTTLVASFQNTAINDADYARGNPQAGGFGMIANTEGLTGYGTRTGKQGAHIHFQGENNISPQRGTVRLAIRGELWHDHTPRWLWEARGSWRIGVRRDKTGITLLIHEGRDINNPVSQIHLPLSDITTDQWHTVVASWDRDQGEGMIAVDGYGLRGAMKFPESPKPFYILYIAGGFGGRLGGLNIEGMDFDELVVYDQPVSILEQKMQPLPEPHNELLPLVESGIRLTLNFLADLQVWGGWMRNYTWPTLIGAWAQGREAVDYPDALSNDKGLAAPHTASIFLYAYEVLGDYRFLSTALNTGEYLLAAQDKRGFWVHQYRMTHKGVQPIVSDTHVKLQDSATSHSIFFLTYLYRLTEDERYLDAVKKAGEFYLQAQNPNGSWSHHWDAVAGIGRTHGNRHIQGGEINDNTMNDGIDVMLLMYHITQDRRYLESLKRAADWLVEAQIDGGGWAQQYDNENNPAQARHFEPPAIAWPGIVDAVKALIEVYRISGDEIYLQPVRDCLDWAKRTFPDGEMWHYHDPLTGKGIGQWREKIYELDNPEDFAWLSNQPTGIWYLRKKNVVNFLERELKNSSINDDFSPIVTHSYASSKLENKREMAEIVLATQNEAGVWVRPVYAEFMGSIGQGFSSASREVKDLLRYAEAGRMLRGEIALQYRGNGDLIRMAWPEPDWYNVPWP